MSNLGQSKTEVCKDFSFECLPKYRTCAIINRGYNYFFLKPHIGFSLIIGGIPLKICGYKTRAVINQAQLITACVRYIV